MKGFSTVRATKPAFRTAPKTLADTGISKNLLEQLALKILGLRGEMSLIDLAPHIGLGLAAVEEIFQALRREQLCEVKGMQLGTYRISLSSQGKARSMDLLAANSYAGPSPVSLAEYTSQVRLQSARNTIPRAADLLRAFGPLVLDADLFLRLGTAIVSGTSMFLYGPPGTGKTSIANCIADIFEDTVLIPHSIAVDDQIISVFDPSVHRRIEGPVSEEADLRWAPCRRPRVLAGGELSASDLQLQFSTVTRFHNAPLQIKANNGVLVLDDFGRQRIPPSELLNRWMTPLDCGYDFLTLSGGKKIEVPFDLFVVFATNIDPADLADEAFLRRIPNKIKTEYASPEQFAEIFRAECAARELSFDPAMAQHLIQFLQQKMKRPLAQCYARDIINQILWNAAYLRAEAQITPKALEAACRNYFLSAAKSIDQPFRAGPPHNP